MTLAVLTACDDGKAPASKPPPVTGLNARPSNITCVAPERPIPPKTLLATQRAFANLKFTFPLALLQAPGDGRRWFVVEHRGRVLIFDNDPQATSTETFIDVADRLRVDGNEMGLTAMAFHPSFPADPRVYLGYTAETNPVVSRISEFTTSDNGATLDPQSERILLSVAQPHPEHNGAQIGFGPDGHLYIGFGDGGNQGDPHGPIGNGQDLNTLHGKILRINVNTPAGGFLYSIPASNPFAGDEYCGDDGDGTEPCAEIFAIGFRNPWRWSFDRESGDLWVGDVGQGGLEEVDRVQVGGNYGWRCREGTEPFNPECGDGQNLLEPVAQYDRHVGRSVTGGYVYRGSAQPLLQGQYIFGDFGSGRIWHIAADTQPTLAVTDGYDSGLMISSFGEANDGEIYALDYFTGEIHHIVESAPNDATIPAQLTASGCVSASDATQSSPGMIPYAPAVPFWSDGASKERWIGLPDGESITLAEDGRWDFPLGTVLMKSFRLGTRLVETRLLMRHPDGVWAGYTYEWNDAQTDAIRVSRGKSVSIDGYAWIFPSEGQCLQCHTSAGGRVLSLRPAQMNGDFTYLDTGRTANQLTTLTALGIIPAMDQHVSTLPALPNPFSTTAPLAQRARAYLHVNCSQCHRPGGGTPVGLDFRYTTPLDSTHACNEPPHAGDLGIADARIIAPGESLRSVLVARISRRDAMMMPPIGSAHVDEAGVSLISSWIDSLSSCKWGI